MSLNTYAELGGSYLEVINVRFFITNITMVVQIQLVTMDLKKMAKRISLVPDQNKTCSK